MTTIAIPAVIKDARRRQRRLQLRLAALTIAFLLLTIAASLTVFRVNLTGGPLVSFRQQETYQATEAIVVRPVAYGTGQGPDPNYARPYVQLANSESIRALTRQAGPPHGTYHATELTINTVQVSGTANSPHQAIILAQRASATLIAYVKRTPREAIGRWHQRMLVGVLVKPTKAVLIHGRNFTNTIVAFGLLILLLTLGASTKLKSQNRRTPPTASQ